VTVRRAMVDTRVAIASTQDGTKLASSGPVMRALVLAGGGVAGIAWELGVLRGVADIVPDLLPGLAEADLLVGTSAGSAVAAQITSGAALDALYTAQLSPTTGEIEVDFDPEAQTAQFAAVTAGATSVQDMRQRLGALALATHATDELARRAAVAARLPVHAWPDRRLLVTAVDAQTGELAVFTRDSGVDLIDAVAASCAIPGVWPPVTINGRRYIDGAMRSSTNADLAARCDRVLIITPSADGAPSPWGGLDKEVDRLQPAEVTLVYADAASQTAFGRNPLSPATRAPAARAGRIVGQKHAAAIATFWQ
jgi:NTE family protein